MNPPFYCNDCKCSFTKTLLSKHEKCIEITCGHCRRYPVIPAEHRLISWHQNKRNQYNTCRGLSECRCGALWNVLDHNTGKLIRNPKPCRCPPLPVQKAITLVDPKEQKKVQCQDCNQIFQWNEDHHKNQKFQDVKFHLLTLNMTVLEILLPKELRNMVAEYCVYSLKCDGFSLCIGCGGEILKSKFGSHYCTRLTLCNHCDDLLDKSVLDSHLASSTKCQQGYSLVSCPYCNENIETSKLALHKIRCPMSLTKCSHCRKKFKLKDIDSHNCSSKPSTK
jgi:hypothetical protein